MSRPGGSYDDNIVPENRRHSALRGLALISTEVKKCRIAALVAGCSAFFVLALMLAPLKPEIQPDSIGYLQFAPDRTAGYPMFLALVGWFGGQLWILSPIQLLILCSATLFLSIAVNRLTDSLLCAAVAAALMLGNIEVVKYCFRVMTEALFISLIACALGCVAYWFAARRLRWIAAASIFVGAAVAVRPGGNAVFVMFPILFVSALHWERRRALTLAAMILPAAAVLFLNLAAYHQRHGTWDPPSVLGYNLLGKTVAFADGTEPSARPDLIAAVADVAARYRARFVVGDTWFDRVFLAAPVYDDIRRHLPAVSDAGQGADRATTRLALDIIAAHKAAYLRNVAENYAALWYAPELMTAQDVARLKGQLAAVAMPAGASIEYALIPRPWPLVVTVRLFLFAVLTISLIFLIALPVQLVKYRQADAKLWFGFAAASALHASLVIVAAINESKPRLMLDNWPLMTLLVVLALNWLRLSRQWSMPPRARNCSSQ